MRIRCDFFRGITGVVDENILGDDEKTDGMPEFFSVKSARIIDKFHQIERGQITGAVINKHVFRTWIAGIDPPAVDAGMPAIDRGIVLQARIAADMRSFSNQAQQIAGIVRVNHLPVRNSMRLPVGIVLYGSHELIGDPH